MIEKSNKSIANEINENYINAFGNETIEKMDDKLFINEQYSFDEYVEHVYCNKNNPKNHNVYISNYKDSNMHIFDGTQLILKKKEDVCEAIKLHWIKRIEKQCKIIKLNHLNENDKIRMSKINDILEGYEENNDFYKSLGKNIEMIIFNNNEIIKQTYTKLKIKIQMQSRK